MRKTEKLRNQVCGKKKMKTPYRWLVIKYVLRSQDIRHCFCCDEALGSDMWYYAQINKQGGKMTQVDGNLLETRSVEEEGKEKEEQRVCVFTDMSCALAWESADSQSGIECLYVCDGVSVTTPWCHGVNEWMERYIFCDFQGLGEHGTWNTAWI